MIERLLLFIKDYPLDFISYFSSGLPIIIGYYRLKNLSIHNIYIWYLFIFLFIKDTYSLIHMFLIPNILYVQNLEAIIETIIVGIIYFYNFDKESHKKLIILFIAICAGIEIIYYKSSDVSSTSLSVFRAFSIIISLVFFNKLLTDMRVKNIVKHTMFWFTSSLLIYSAGTFFIMLFSGYWYQDNDKVSAALFDKYWNVSQYLFIVFCFLSAYGLWVSKYDKENVV